MTDPAAGVGVTAFSPVPAATPAWNSRGKVQADSFLEVVKERRNQVLWLHGDKKPGFSFWRGSLFAFQTRDQSFLSAHYPIMANSARYYLANAGLAECVQAH